MVDNERDGNVNPPTIIGAPVRPPSREELMAWHARNGTLVGFLKEIGDFHDADFVREGWDRDRGR